MGSIANPATRVDPITASIVHGALDNIAVEMGHKLMRMSYSSIIRESEDFGAAICDAVGRQLCECSISTPLQSGPIPGYVRGILSKLAEQGDTVRPGDLFIHNDPYRGASHAPDIGFCLPVFLGEKLIGFSVTTAHHLDIGSCQPGSVGVVKCADSFAEGLRMSALRVYDQGRRNDALWQMIADNVRVPDLVIGDMEAQISACRTGAARLIELVERFGEQTLFDAVEDLFDYSERLMRQQIAALPDGEWTATGHVDGYLDSEDPAHRDLPITVTVRIAGSDLTIDFAGTAPQLHGHCINMPFEGTVDVAVWLTLRSILLDSDVFGPIPQNAGLYRSVKITAPKGCIANPEMPVPTIARFVSGNIVADTVMRAMAQIVPEKVSAGISNLKAIAFSGLQGNQHWVHIEIFEGSYGGRAGKDGLDSVDTLYANTRNNPIEDIEAHVPLRVHRYELRDGHAAPGRWRGGLNSVKEVEFLADGAVSVEGDGHAHRPWGLSGGADGSTGGLTLRSGGKDTALPSMLEQRAAKAGDRLIAYGGGGGGFGDPFQRDLESIASDLADGYIAADQVKAYGVALDKHARIDDAATQMLRAMMRAAG
jgi:N-methylhydantoinase B